MRPRAMAQPARSLSSRTISLSMASMLRLSRSIGSRVGSDFPPPGRATGPPPPLLARRVIASSPERDAQLAAERLDPPLQVGGARLLLDQPHQGAADHDTVREPCYR